MLQKRIDGYMPRGYWAIHKISQENPRIIETVTKKIGSQREFCKLLLNVLQFTIAKALTK